MLTNDQKSNFSKYSLQLEKFKEELSEAGGFEQLMLKKGAIKTEKGLTYVISYRDIKWYKRIYLTGVYKPLREIYDTEIPYQFWSTFSEALNDIEKKQ